MEVDMTWEQPLIDYIKDHKLPEEKVEAGQIVWGSKLYTMIGETLYQRGTRNGILMKSISRAEGIDILNEIHSGECGNHVASRTIMGKAFRSGFNWLTALHDAEEIVQHCKACQYFTHHSHTLAHKIKFIPPSRPFACWGLDMVGPLPTAPRGFKWLYVTIDKFSKWIEVFLMVQHSVEKMV